MYIGDGQIAHARNPQMGVAVTAVDYSPWNMMGLSLIHILTLPTIYSV